MIKKLPIVLIALIFCSLAFAQNAFLNSPDTEVFDFLNQNQITNADSYQAFLPNSILDRASLIKMLILSSELTQKDADDCIADKLSRKWQFVYHKDVKINDWFAPYVCVGVEKNLLPKFGKFLKPSKEVTFLEAVQVLFYGLNKNGFFLNIDPNLHPKVLFAEIQKLGLPVSLSDIHKKISRGDFGYLLLALFKKLSDQSGGPAIEETPLTDENKNRVTVGTGVTPNIYIHGDAIGSSSPPQIPSCYATVPPVTGPVNQTRIWPISGALTPDVMSSAFGPRLQASAGFLYDFHRGVDIPASVGTPVKAVADGTVSTVYLESDPQNPYPNGGTVIGIKHEDSGVYYSLYQHLSSVAVQKDQTVKKGDVIGLSGNSGITTFDHLHFEIRENDINSASEPHRNPFSYLPYNNTASHAAQILETSKIDAKNPVVTVRVKSPRNELDINKIKITIYRWSGCAVLSTKEVDFNKRINSGSDNPLANGVTLNPAGFDKDSSEYSLDATFSSLTGADDSLLAVAEVTDVTGNTVYTETGIAKPVSLIKLPDSNTRAMWVWGYWEQLKNNVANTTDFINFLKAPHGNTAYAINRIFLSRDGALDFSNASDVASMQSFLKTANANNIVTEALFSDYGWAYTAEKHIPIGLCQNVIDFNKSTPATDDDFAGIHFDIEPHTLPEWEQNSAGGLDAYNNELEANLLDIMMQCRQKVTASGLPLTLTLDVPPNWHKSGADIWVPLTAGNSPVDYISVMNYFDSPDEFINGWGTKGGVKNILADANGMPMVFGAEISDLGATGATTSTFFEEGYLEMESAFSLAKSQYSGNNLFRGVTIEHYNSYKIASPTPPAPPPPPPPPVSPCASAQTVFITDQTVRQEPALSKPAAGVSYRDPIFDTCVTRITDVSTDLIAPDTSKGFKNEYSRVNSWNSDQSKILIRSLSAYWYVYNATTLKPVKMLSIQGSVDPRWDATNPDILYFIDGTTINTYNVSTDNITVLRDFSGDFPGQTVSAVWTRYEGSPTSDSRYWGLMAEDQNWNTFALLIYDAQQNIITANRTLSQPYDIDNVSISPLGNYFTAFYDYCPAGTLGTDQAPCGLMVYDKNLQNGRGLLRAIGHSDFAIRANGKEVFVYQDVNTDNISVLDLETGAITDLFPIDFSHSSLGIHISGQNFSKPGWALISMYNGSYPVNMTWMDNQTFAVDLETGKVFRIAHHHSLYDANMVQDYWAEPQASVNRDFTKILFTSNWGKTGTEETDAYLVTLPANWDQTAFNPPTYWVPPKTTSFDIQLQSPVNQTVNVAVMDIDMFDTDASVVSSLHSQGKKVFCYISAGSYENWRPDQASFPLSVLGNDYVGWPGEKWLDIRQIGLLAPIMRARMDLCKSKGFDGIDFDNISGYQNNTGFPLTYADQLAYNKWLATEAHSRGLSVGLKNDGAQVTDLLSDFDWAITESCYADGWCNEMKPFADAGKAVFEIEYTENGTTLPDFCPTAASLGLNGLLKNKDLGDWRGACS